MRGRGTKTCRTATTTIRAARPSTANQIHCGHPAGASSKVAPGRTKASATAASQEPATAPRRSRGVGGRSSASPGR